MNYTKVKSAKPIGMTLVVELDDGLIANIDANDNMAILAFAKAAGVPFPRSADDFVGRKIAYKMNDNGTPIFERKRRHGN